MTGTVLSARAAQKVRRQEAGHLYVRRRLMALGAPAPNPDDDPAGWLALALNEVSAIRLRHGGCHRYVWRLDPTAGLIDVALPAPAYPKAPDRCQDLLT